MQLKNEQLAALNGEISSLSNSLTAQKAKLSKELSESDKTLREALSKKEE